MSLTCRHAHVDQVLNVVRFALAELFPVNPLRHKHSPSRELGIVLRNHDLTIEPEGGGWGRTYLLLALVV